jgi:trk system potassium uptake protein TrkA
VRILGQRSAKNEFAVVGLGHFGASLARRLEVMGHAVLGIDNDPMRIQAIADEITSAVILDAANEDALQEVDIAAFGTVIVGIDNDFEVSALVTAHLKGLGIGRVICLAKTSRHRDILMRIGADQVILSDEDSGIRLAETLAQPAMLERVLLDAEHSLVELRTPDSLAAQPVSRLAQYGITVLLIHRQQRLLPCPNAETKLEAGDTLFVIGRREHLLQITSLP